MENQIGGLDHWCPAFNYIYGREWSTLVKILRLDPHHKKGHATCQYSTHFHQLYIIIVCNYSITNQELG